MTMRKVILEVDLMESSLKTSFQCSEVIKTENRIARTIMKTVKNQMEIRYCDSTPKEHSKIRK